MSSNHIGSSNQKMSSGSARAQKRWQVGRSHLPLASIAIVTRGPTAERTALDALDVDHRVGMADLELQAPEAVMLDGASALGHQVVLGDRQPADVGIVGFELFLRGAAKQLPQRQARGLGAQIPERDIDRGERELGDAGAPHPSHGGEAGELLPEPVALRGVLADEQRSVALRDAGGDQPVGRQMRVRSGEAEAFSPSAVTILAPTTPQCVIVWVESEIDSALSGTCRMKGSTDRIFKARALRSCP